MRALAQPDFVQIWDQGEGRHELDRALLLLHRGLPEWSMAELGALSIGRRDGLLLELRGRTFGERVDFFVTCPRCGEGLEDRATVAELTVADPWQPRPPVAVARDDLRLELRAVTSRDLARVAALPAEAAAGVLARSCLLAASRDGRGLSFEELDGEALALLGEGMSTVDPQAELEFELVCPACGYEWSALFDVASFFWREVVARAKVALHDVVDLARVFHWSEAEILAMAPSRRAFYLARIES